MRDDVYYVNYVSALRTGRGCVDAGVRLDRLIERMERLEKCLELA